MVGRNAHLVAKKDGHNPHAMLTTCAAWTEGEREMDVEAIRRAMKRSPGRACSEQEEMPRQWAT